MDIITDFLWGMLERSIQSGILIVIIMLIRKATHKIPKKTICILWALAALRLIVPVTIESRFSLMPNVGEWLKFEKISCTTTQRTVTLGKTDVSVVRNEIVNDAGGGSQYDSAINGIYTAYTGGQEPYIEDIDIIGVNKTAGHKVLFIVAAVWIVGTEIMLLYGIYCYLRTKYLVREAVIYKDNIKLCDRTDSAFVFGIVNPWIYIPFGLDDVQLRFILAHERAHVSRRDYISEIVGFLILSFYWFNPFVWAAYILFCHDVEMACDEQVVRELGEKEKKRYAQILLQRSITQRSGIVAPLAFSGVSVKARVKNILDYKKPDMWITIVSVMICMVFCGCGLTFADTEGDEEEPGTEFVNYEEMENKSESVDYDDMKKQAELIYNRIEHELYKTGKQADHSFDEIISAMSDDEMAARVTLQSDDGTLAELLIISDLIYKFKDSEDTGPFMAAMGGKIYCSLGGMTYDLGEVHSSGTAYPIEHSEDSIYISGGHYAARFVVDTEKNALKIEEFVVVAYDENGNEMYFTLNDGELTEEKDGSCLYKMQGDGTVTDFWIDSGMADLTDKSMRSMWHLVDFDLPDEANVSYSMGAGHVDELQDVVSGIVFQWEGEKQYTTQCVNIYYNYAGGIYSVPNADEYFVFQDGKLVDMNLMSDKWEYFETLGPLEGCQEQAVIYEIEDERFTASQVEVAKNAGTPIPEDEVNAKIWYVAYAREDMPYGYILVLNERYFAEKGNMLDIARNITFKKGAWY